MNNSAAGRSTNVRPSSESGYAQRFQRVKTVKRANWDGNDQK